jgi:ectoine hydroxylase-related dioxygenase (phytanoyl-CoA dioxygenase family)
MNRLVSATLPQPVLDLAEAKADLEQHGYCLVADAIAPETVSALRELLSGVAEREVQTGDDYLYSGGSNQRVWSLLNKGAAFAELAENEVALALAEHLLGEHPLLSNLSANIAGPGGEPMAMHWDQDFVPRPWPYPLMAHVIWMLDDFTPENGATLVVPGSHRLDGPPDAEPIPATGPAGTAFCLDARTWHGTGANRTSERRHGILAYYCRLFVRQQENYFLSLDRTVLESATPRLRELLGFTQVNYVGMVDGPPRSWPRY